MFPLILTFLNRDCRTPFYNPYSGLLRRGNVPSLGVLGFGFGVLGLGRVGPADRSWLKCSMFLLLHKYPDPTSQALHCLSGFCWLGLGFGVLGLEFRVWRIACPKLNNLSPSIPQPKLSRKPHNP